METTAFSRDALLETLRSYYRDRQVLFRNGFGSQLQFRAAEEERRMKKLTPEALVELARAYLKSPYISAPQWDKEKKRWGPHFATRHFNFELRCRRIHRHAQNRGRHQTASTVDVAAVSAMPPDPTLGRLRSEYCPLYQGIYSWR